MRYNFEDLGDLLLPNSSNSISWNELDLDSVGELKSVHCFEQTPVFSPNIIFSNLNRGIPLASDFVRNSVSPTLVLNDYGGDGTTADENGWEEVKGEKFRLELSTMACESNHRNSDVRRQEWQNFHFPAYPNSKIKLDLYSYGNPWSGDDFERNPVPPTSTFNNGGDGTVEEIFREGKDFPTFVFNNNGRNGTGQEYIQEVREREFSLRISHVCESSHRHFGGGRQQLQNFRPIVRNFLDTPNSGVKLTFDSNDETWSFDDFERSPISPNLILNNNCGDGTVEENSWDEKVSQALILDNNGGDGTVQENTREEVEGRKFPLGVSFGCPRQNSENFHWVSPNFPLGDEIMWLDNFDRHPVSTTFFLNDNGGNGGVEENNWEDEALDFSEKAPKSDHRSLSRQRQQPYPRKKCMHCLSEETPQWRSGPMGPKTLCNACGIRHRSNRLLPEYRPAGSPSFDSLKHSNFHRKIVKNSIRN